MQTKSEMINRIAELAKENAELKGIIDAYKMSENEANEIIAELKAYKDVNEDFKTAYVELKAENYELIETLKVYQRPDIVSVLTDYRTGELDRLREEVERLSKIETKLENYKRFYKETHAKLDELDCVKGYYKYKQTLQEIKKYIAKICKEECGYVQKKRCPDCDCRFGAILDLITKAESEV